ncbi:hypothetical protein GCM10007967_02700 [Xylanimonas ulmi]
MNRRRPREPLLEGDPIQPAPSTLGQAHWGAWPLWSARLRCNTLFDTRKNAPVTGNFPSVPYGPEEPKPEGCDAAPSASRCGAIRRRRARAEARTPDGGPGLRRWSSAQRKIT